MNNKCLWTYDDDTVYTTGCGEAWFFDSGTPKENKVNFCMFCGKPVELRSKPMKETSSVTERYSGMVTVMGYNHDYPKTTRGFLDFITTPYHRSYSFIMVSRCESTIELSEKTARAFANEILRRCDKVKKQTKEQADE